MALPRDKIAEDNNIGTGSVSSIIANYKVGLEFDSLWYQDLASNKS
jgi:hypothetical protein